MATPTYTRGSWATALVKALATGKDTSGYAAAIGFVVGWTTAEYSQKESETASYNCLNMERGADIESFNPTVVSGNGIVAFKTFSDGIFATASRLQSNPAYQPIVNALANNDQNALQIAVGISNIPVATAQPSDAVKEAIRVWVKGPHGGQLDPSYLPNLDNNVGNGSQALTGVTGDSTINNASGVGSQPGGGSTPNLDPKRIVKIFGGALMILAAVALLIKSFTPSVKGAIGAK